jgi:hypothetical protein
MKYAKSWLFCNKMMAIIIAMAIIFISCERTNLREILEQDPGHLKQAKVYSGDVAIAWMKMQLEITRTYPTPLAIQPFRHFAYCGIALYETVLPGMPEYRSLSGQLTDMPMMPQIIPGLSYHWPTCANAALAAINHSFFPSPADPAKVSMDSLENTLNALYRNTISEEEFNRSVSFGKAVASAVYQWAVNDGSATMIDPAYTPPTGPGLWEKTPPGFGNPVGPHWGTNRLLVAGSLEGSAPDRPTAYSEEPLSDFYKMVQEVYDVSQTLSADQVATALYYRESPGYGNAHSLSTTMQVLQQTHSSLDMAALVYAKTGISIYDASVGCWSVKYQYNLVRPITYIRKVLAHPDWNSLFPTPPHPKYTSGHSVLAASLAESLESFFGSDFHFTDHTYDYLGMTPRSFNSFEDMAKEIANARVLAGIHYRNSCLRGLKEGKTIAKNVNRELRFMK